MKALLVSGIYRPDIGGPATYVPRLAEFLQKQGFSIGVLTLRSRNVPKVKESWTIDYVTRDLFFPIRFFQIVFKAIKTISRNDYVFANGLHEEIGIALFIIRKPSLAKIVGDPVWERARNSGSTQKSMIDFNKQKLSFKYFLQRRLLVWCLNQYDAITCPSKELVEVITLWGVKTPLVHIPNGVLPIPYEEREKKYDVISVSRLVPWKNIDQLVIACKKIDVSLIIIGSGPEEEKLKELSATIRADVKFLGDCEASVVASSLMQSRIFALISDYEGLSFSLIEAMSLGMPIITSMARGNTDVIENNVNGIIVNSNVSDEIAKAISDLLENAILAKKLGQQAKAKMEKEYNEANQLLKMCDLLLGTKHLNG
jgi:glycosyltransferase involved in cell wall biosynthesis